MPNTKRPTSWGEMDMTLLELEYTGDLLDAVRIAIGANEMPSDAAANAVFSVEMLLRHVTKELRAEWDADYSESDAENDSAPP